MALILRVQECVHDTLFWRLSCARRRPSCSRGRGERRVDDAPYPLTDTTSTSTTIASRLRRRRRTSWTPPSVPERLCGTPPSATRRATQSSRRSRPPQCTALQSKTQSPVLLGPSTPKSWRRARRQPRRLARLFVDVEDCVRGAVFPPVVLTCHAIL